MRSALSAGTIEEDQTAAPALFLNAVEELAVLLPCKHEVSAKKTCREIHVPMVSHGCVQ